MKIGDFEFPLGKRTYIMGILNITPDSFSDGGVHDSIEKAVSRAFEMVAEGADIIDVGGESTRPDHVPVSESEELARVIPVLEALAARGLPVPVSIDTYKAAVAEAALSAGAALVNDIWGFKKDPDIARVCAKHGVPCCLMHNRENTDYTDFLNDMLGDLRESVEIALSAGVSPERIIVDPGIGFAKTYEQNLFVMRNLSKLSALGYPVLLGASRKRMIGYALDLPVDQRLEGTLAASVIGVTQRCDFIRVHDVLANKRACTMADKIVRG
ncbi:MAG: dihydropteroate synthase [Clostridiales bacterium]|jgi:dihydropteroate synthase|nr:dihydropteroate synthase [Clostridiales bacterium]